MMLPKRNMYNCPKCNQPFEAGTKYCTKCGCNLEESFIEDPICPVCRKSYPAGSTYCIVDGTKLVSSDKLIPKCVICNTQYPADTKFCPKDGGAIIPEALRSFAGNSYHNDSNEYIVKSDIGIRFIAAIIDVLIEAGLSVPAIAFYMLGVAGFTTNSLGYPVHRSLPIFFILSFFAYFIPIIYMLIKDGIGEGQSFGKKIMRIKVIKVNDLSNCTMGVSVIRNLIGIFIVLIPFVGWLIEPIMVLVSSDGRRVADRIAGTMVVNV